MTLPSQVTCLVASLLLAPVCAQADAPSSTLEHALQELHNGLKRGSADMWDHATATIEALGSQALPELELLAASHDFRARFLTVRTASRSLEARGTDAETGDRELARFRALVVDGLADEHPAVRSLARELISHHRSAEAIPILISRLEHARDLEREETLTLLSSLTRIPIGDAHAAWASWWEEAGADFDLPPPGDDGLQGPAREGPRYHGETVSSRNVVFVVDRSKSMEWGNRLGRAKQELQKTIKGLAEDVRFNIIFFGGRVSAWKRELTPATPHRKREAVHWVMEKQIIYSTATWEALQAAFSCRGVDTIYLLSDGDPNVGAYTDTDQICRQVRATNTFARVRIFTIGFFFGAVPAKYQAQARATEHTRSFMQKLARENRGRFIEVDE